MPNLNDFAVIKGLFKCDFTFRSHNYKNIRFRMGYVAMSDEIYENSVFKPLFTFVRCIQGCAPAEPGTRKSQIFHTNHMLGTLDFTVSEHWAPFNFS